MEEAAQEVVKHFGYLGFVPPLLAIILALVTKDVIFSVFLGIASGALIWAGGNPFAALIHVTDLLADKVADGWNIRIFLFCGLLGGLVGMLTRAGSARAFGQWTAGFIRGRRSAQLFSWLFGMIVFIDDYFNSLAIGSVMRPITDRNHVSRAKLSYILDSTAAPVCIIAPVSSWVVTVISQIRASSGFEELDIGEMSFFVNLIPYNLYALFALVMVVIVSLTNRDFGPMATSEDLVKNGLLFNEKKYGPAPGQLEAHEEAKGAVWYDMVIPMAVLIAACVIAFPMSTYISLEEGGTSTLIDAFRNADASKALFYGIIFSLIVSYLYFLGRRILTIKMASDSIIDGIKSMVPALAILMLAWTIGHIINQPVADGGLGLPSYINQLLSDNSFPMWLLPLTVFLLSCFISFSTGTSWGTFAIMIPITLPTAISLAKSHGLAGESVMQLALISTAAVLSGGVFGDHSSPISDTTILSSAGGGCPHLEHVGTQFPYALFVAICAGVGIIVGGVTLNPFAAFTATAIVFFVFFFLVAKPGPDNENLAGEEQSQ
ncbi:MAG: Na+/H+ antiporter NhaC family protein [Planctomycetota bacterium]|jgi:Na+/H+ antiporter NhaC|nr:Na+/H+ antiporter NhaC family protein [Planctomycetota bacterium]